MQNPLTRPRLANVACAPSSLTSPASILSGWERPVLSTKPCAQARPSTPASSPNTKPLPPVPTRTRRSSSVYSPSPNVMATYANAQSRQVSHELAILAEYYLPRGSNPFEQPGTSLQIPQSGFEQPMPASGGLSSSHSKHTSRELLEPKIYHPQQISPARTLEANKDPRSTNARQTTKIQAALPPSQRTGGTAAIRRIASRSRSPRSNTNESDETPPASQQQPAQFRSSEQHRGALTDIRAKKDGTGSPDAEHIHPTKQARPASRPPASKPQQQQQQQPQHIPTASFPTTQRAKSLVPRPLFSSRQQQQQQHHHHRRKRSPAPSSSRSLPPPLPTPPAIYRLATPPRTPGTAPLSIHQDSSLGCGKSMTRSVYGPSHEKSPWSLFSLGKSGVRNSFDSSGKSSEQTASLREGLAPPPPLGTMSKSRGMNMSRSRSLRRCEKWREELKASITVAGPRDARTLLDDGGAGGEEDHARHGKTKGKGKGKGGYRSLTGAVRRGGLFD